MNDTAKQIADGLIARLKRGELSKVGRDEVEAAVDEVWPRLGRSELDKNIFRRRVYHFVVRAAL